MTDPMEKLIADALDASATEYMTDHDGNPSGLDFRLSNGVEIEVKRFHSERIAAQMACAPNVIAVQGKEAVEYLACLIYGYGRREPALQKRREIYRLKRDAKNALADDTLTEWEKYDFAMEVCEVIAMELGISIPSAGEQSA